MEIEIEKIKISKHHHTCKMTVDEAKTISLEHPIILRDGDFLVDGLRRLTAAKLLGYKTIVFRRLVIK